MVKLRFTQSDIARMMPPEKGWHLFELKEVREQPSKNKDSINYYLNFEVVESAVSDDNVGRYAERIFNSKGLGFFVPFLAACWDCTTDEAVQRIQQISDNGEEIDLEALIGSKVWNEVIEEPYENRILKRMSDNWAPENSTPPF